MGTYKVIQDIEAEDKLLGPLTLRQFVYAIIVIVSLFIGFKLVTGPGVAKYFAVLLIPQIVFFAVLAAPFGHDQSNEVWLLAKIRFFFKPRVRIWDQTGMKELVTITAPKKIEKQLTKDFSRDEARNRLKALANTLDTRGWAVKSADFSGIGPAVQPVTPPPTMLQPVMPIAPPIQNNNIVAPTDRLVDVGTDDPMTDDNIATPYDDIDSEVAQKIVTQINESKEKYRNQLSHMMTIPTPDSGTTATNDNTDDIDWFAPEQPDDNTAVTIKPPITNEHKTPSNHLANSHRPNGHTSARNTNNHNTSQLDTTENASPMVSSFNSDIINLANNNDLNVETLQRQADKSAKENDDDEVVISLR